MVAEEVDPSPSTSRFTTRVLAGASWRPKLQVARQMYAPKPYTIAAVAKTLGVSRASVYRHLTPSAAGQATAVEAVDPAV